MAREAMAVCLRVLKESNKSRFDSYSVRNGVLIIPYITFRDCRVQFFLTTFLEIAVYKEHAKSRSIVCIPVKRSRAARTRFTSKDELGCLDE